MAKKSIIAREKVRTRLSKLKDSVRTTLRTVVKSADASFDEKVEAQTKLQKLSRKSSKTALTRRCRQCGRPRGTYRKFGLCRIHLREALMRGDIPGGRKASW